MVARLHLLISLSVLTTSCNSFAQSSVLLFPITNVWRFEQAANLDGTNWQASAFNDSAWPSGLGLLYVEDNVSVTPKNTPLTIGRLTYYFRTHFEYTNSATGIGLTFSNLVDDGAVFYLNGSEIRRVRMPAQPQSISNATLATSASLEANHDVFTISGDLLTNLVAGDNVLAVEVHQNSAASTDIVFGSSLSVAASSGAFTFTAQPTNVTVLDGRPVTLRVATSATVTPALQWFKDGIAIPGATLTTLTFPTAAPSDSGSYFVVASNSSLVLTSSPAAVTVIVDDIPPTVVRAVAQKDLTNIIVDFSEPVRPGATNLSNFQIARSGQPADTLAVLSATLTNQTNLVLTTTPRADRRNYELRLTNIVDFAFASNQVSSAPIPLKYITELLRIDTNSLWRFDQSGICPPTNWFTPDFDDSVWQTGGPLFSASPSGPVPIGVTLGLANFFGSGPVITYYFRTEFDLPGMSTNALLLRHIIDDGAVLYLNSLPIYSVRMNPAPTCQSFATANPGAPAFEPPLAQAPFSVSNSAVPGINLLAAEVHQISSNSPDVAFAVSLDALIDEFIPGLSMTLPTLVTNGVGVLTNAGRVTLSEVTTSNVVVVLGSTASSALSVPATVTVIAGETNGLFDVTVASNSSTMGPRRIAVNANASGFLPGRSRTVVLDSVPGTLSLIVLTNIVEGTGPFTGRVEIAASLAQDVAVTLTSTARNTVGVPPRVIIPAGETSAVFQLVIPNNSILEDTRTATITAHVPGWLDGLATINVFDKPDSYRALALTTRDLAYDPVTQRIYASVPDSAPTNASLIIPIVPETATLEAGFSIGREPGSLMIDPAGGKLYATVETNHVLRRIDLLSRTTELSFAPIPASIPGTITVSDFALLPGSPRPIAVLQLRDSFQADVAIYDEGVRRPDFVHCGGDGYQEIIEAAADGSAIYFQSWGFQGFRRILVNPQGVTNVYVDSSLTPGQWTRDWKAVDSRLFGSDGVIIDPLVPQIIATIPNIPVNSLMCYDADIGRIFYLSPSGGNWMLRAYETASLAAAGTVTISGVSGTPSSLIRCGQNILAFRTDANQLFLLKTTLLPTNPPTDIALSLTITPAPYLAGSNISETIVITNQGPNAADIVSWTNTLPAGAVVISAEASAGSVTIVSNIVRGAVAEFSAQAAIHVSVVFRPNAAGVVRVAGTVASSARETSLTNNSVVLPIWVRDSDPSASSILNLAVKGIARDPVRSRLYFSIGSSASLFPDSVLVMDFAAGTVAPIPMNGDPGRMAVSANGQFLYVALDTAAAVRRLSLPSLSIDLSVSFPDSRPVTDLSVCPTNPSVIAVWRQFDNSYSAYEQGILLPSGATACFNNVGFFGDKVVNGTYYDNNGMIFDVSTRQFHGILPIPFNSLVEPDPVANRIFSLTVPNGVPGWAIRAFDADQFTEVGYSFATLDSPSDFLRWGVDGFVFRTANQVYLLRSPLVPTNPPTDVILRATVSAGSALSGATIGYNLCVTNLGSNTAFGVVLTQAFSLSVTGLVTAADAGTVTNTANFVTWQIPPLPPGSGHALTVSLQATQQGTLVARSAVRHSANDPVLNNNFALNITRIGEPSTNEIREIALTTRELVYDSVRQKIYASVPAREPLIGNSVIAIDPVTTRTEALAFAGSEPNQLALSDDGRFLYVSLDGSKNCRRVDLTGQQPPSRFPRNSSDSFIPYDMQVQPGFPDVLAVTGGFARSNGISGSGTALLDDQGLRPAISGNTTSIAFSPDGQFIYGSIPFGEGFGFVRFVVDSNGVSVLDATTSFSDDYDFKLQNNLLYSGLGRVIDPTIPTVLATFGVNGPVEPDSQLGRIFQVPLSDTTTELRAYAMSTYQLLGTMPLPTARPYARHLIRCGGNRLAFRTDNGGQVFLLRTSLAIIDSDGDGISDNWELEFFHSTDAPNGGAQLDFDGDGISNLEEYLNGTDPTDPFNSLRITRISINGAAVQLQFHGVTGVRYQLQKAPTANGPWVGSGPTVTGDGRRVTMTDNLTAPQSQFYRVRKIQ